MLKGADAETDAEHTRYARRVGVVAKLYGEGRISSERLAGMHLLFEVAVGTAFRALSLGLGFF